MCVASRSSKRPRRLSLNVRDVTRRRQLEGERKQREAELAKLEARYRSLVEEIPAVTFVAPFDEVMGELYVCPQIVDLPGFTPQEWLNDPLLWLPAVPQS